MTEIVTEVMELDEPIILRDELDDIAGGHESDRDNKATPAIPLDDSQRRIIQNARFKNWMLQQAQAEMSRPKKSKTEGDEQLSIRQLMAEQESVSIITDPREYQFELFDRAKEQNTIAVLGTGTGKTLIAVLLLRHVLDQELEHRRAGLRPRIAFFLVCMPYCPSQPV